MDFSDGDVFVTTLPSNFTAIKEKTPTQANERAVSINGETTNLDNDKLKSGIIEDITEVGKSIKTDIFHEISDSGSENETPQILGEEYPKLRKSSKPSDSVSLSKKSMRNIIPFRAPSPDSDSELLVPAFGDHEGESYTKTTTMKNYSGSSVAEKYAISTHSDYDVGPTYSAEKDLFIEGNCANDGNNCSKEPVKKKKRSRIEIEEERKAALLRKKAKQKDRQEKLEEKTRQKDARVAQQQQRRLNVEREKLQKQAEKLTKSTAKLNGCIKFITACLDPSLLADGSSGPVESPILQKLRTMEANYKIEPQPHPGSITWQRMLVQHSVHRDELKITSSTTTSEENEVLIVLAAEIFAEMVFSFKQSYQVGYENYQKEHRTLVDFTSDVRRSYCGKKVTFLLHGLEKYLRSLKNKRQRALRNAALGTSEANVGNRKRRRKQITPTAYVTRTDIEEALVDLQIKTGVCVHPCETEEDIAVKIASFTKAVAEKPYKKSVADALGFCTEKLDKASLKVSRDGQGMVKVWQQQIEQFRNVSREMAAAIVAAFPSPQILLEAYKQCSTEREAVHLLKDILVRRGCGTLATSRRIGPELSRRVYIFFHSRDNSELMK